MAWQRAEERTHWERVAWQRAEERTHWERLQRRRGKALGELEKRSKREWSALYGRHQRQREQLSKDCRGVLGRFRLWRELGGGCIAITSREDRARSGTTLLAGSSLGRRWVGIELNVSPIFTWCVSRAIPERISKGDHHSRAKFYSTPPPIQSYNLLISNVLCLHRKGFPLIFTTIPERKCQVVWTPIQMCTNF